MKKSYLLLPGFPAIANYYKKWAKEIEMNYPKLQVIYAKSDVLFSKDLNFEEYNQAMISHYERILLKLKNSKTTILAHSTGAYFALKLLEKHPEKIERIVLIHPYIGNSSVNIFKYANIAYTIDRFLPLSETTAAIINYLSTHLKDFKKVSKKDLNVYFRFGFKQNTYFNKILLDTRLISKYKDKILFFYTINDKWCTNKTIQLLKSISKSKKILLPHDFIIYKKQRNEMIKELKNSSVLQ